MIAELGVYLVGMVGVYYALAVGAISGYRGKLFAVVSILAIGLIAIFRGAVGTDTVNYESMAGVLRTLENWYITEPGFAVLVWVLAQLADSDVVVVRLVAVVFVLGVLAFLRKADRDEMFFMFGYFIPVAFYDYSMNGLRIGLATIFFLLAMQSLRAHRELRAFSHAVVGCLFHYSLIISIGYVIASARLSMRAFGAIGLAGLLLLTAVILTSGDHLVGRISAHGDIASPGALSGLSILIILAIVLAGAVTSSISQANRVLFVIYTGIAMGVSFVLVQYAYAGLRMLDLLSIAAPVALLVLHGREGIKLNWQCKLTLLLAGAIGFMSSLRNFVHSAGEGSAPWVPFEWIF